MALCDFFVLMAPGISTLTYLLTYMTEMMIYHFLLFIFIVRQHSLLCRALY